MFTSSVAAPTTAHPACPPAHPAPAPSDTGLLARIAQGDHAALTALYTRYAPAAHALALRFVRDSHTAEDIVQEVFIRVWRVAPTAHATVHSPSAWLLKITRNLALDTLRRQAVRPQPVESEDALPLFEARPDSALDTEGEAWARVRGRQVRQALGRLPTEQREAIELAFFEGLSHQAIAARQALPLGTVKTRLRLGLRKLASALDGEI